METRTTVYTTPPWTERDSQVARLMATGGDEGDEGIALGPKAVLRLLDALDTARDELAAIRAHCYGPGNESAMDQMLARAKAAEAEVERLRTELDIIANAAPSQWEPDMRDQFQAWAQNRARHAAGLTPPTA